MAELVLVVALAAVVAIGARLQANLLAERRKVMQLLQQLDAERRFRRDLTAELVRSYRLSGVAESRLREVIDNLAAASLAANALRSWTPYAETVPYDAEKVDGNVSEHYRRGAHVD